MAVISSHSLKKEERPMGKLKIAEKDIVKENAYGQRVVVVAKGQPIPDTDPEPAVPISPAVEPSVEDKAVKSSRQRKK